MLAILPPGGGHLALPSPVNGLGKGTRLCRYQQRPVVCAGSLFVVRDPVSREVRMLDALAQRTAVGVTTRVLAVERVGVADVQAAVFCLDNGGIRGMRGVGAGGAPFQVARPFPGLAFVIRKGNR